MWYRSSVKRKPQHGAVAAAAVEAFDGVRVKGEPLRRRILATDVNVLTWDLAIARVVRLASERNGLRVAFVNAQLALIARRKAEVAAALDGFLLLNDGVGVDLASQALYGAPFPANLNGTDFIPALLDALPAGQRLFLLGSTRANIAKAAKVFGRRWPRHSVVGAHHGYFGAKDEAALASTIKAAKPDIVLVGMGCPLQEMWLARNVPEVCPAGFGVGALFDFLTGRFPRAPEGIRRLRLEWAFRLMLEPKRLFHRYIPGNVAFIFAVARQAWTLRRAAHPAPRELDSRPE